MKRFRTCVLWLASMASLCLCWQAANDATASPIVQYMGVWALGAVALWLGYRALERVGCGNVWLWALAALFAGVVTVGQSFAATGTAALVTGAKAKAAVIFVGRTPMYAMGMILLRYALYQTDARASRMEHTTVWALALLVCWSPYLWAVWPGTVSNDSVTQLAQVVGTMPLGSGNPLFQTALLWLFRTLGFGSADASVALYCCVQAVLMAWLLACTARRVRLLGAPAWLSWGMLAFYALCPIFPVFAFCVGKDTNFAMAVLWLMLAALRFVCEEKPRAGWQLLASAVLCALLRNPGVYLAGLTLLGLLVYALRRRWRWPAIGLGALCAVWIGVRLVLVPALGVAPVPETENWSIPLQQTARVVASEPISTEQRAAIDRVMDYAEIQPAYNGELSDPVKNLWRADATAEDKRAFFSTWLALVKEHPATCLSATFHNGYGYLYPGYISAVKPTLLLGAQKRTTLIDGYFDFSVNPRADQLSKLLTRLYDVPLFRLFIAPGLYGWIALFALCCALTGRRKRLALCLTPALFTLLGLLGSAVNAYFRYAMPLYFAAPLCLAVVSLERGSGVKGDKLQ